MDFLYRLLPPARWRLLCLALLVISIALILLHSGLDDIRLYTAALICLAVAFGGNFAFWRCPRCHRALPWKDMLHVERCPHCKADVKNYNGR